MEKRTSPPLLLGLEQKVNPAHTAILVIDMQNDFCSSGGIVSGKADWKRVLPIIPRLQEFLDKARAAKVHIVFTKAVHDPGDLVGPRQELIMRHGRKEACQRGSWGAEFVVDFHPREDELIIEKKKSYSVLVGTDLDAQLQKLGVRTLVLAGVATNVCVESTARDAFARDYYIILASDLTACYDERLYEATLMNIDKYFGQVITAAELLKIWGTTRS